MSENKDKSANGETWEWSEDPENCSITLSGEVDFTVTPKIRERLAAFIEATKGDLTLLLSNLEYIDSSGLAVLIEARKVLAAQERKIVIASIAPQVRRLFDLTQIGELFGL